MATRASLCAAIALVLAAPSAQRARAQAPDIERGRALAQEWCSRCHAISAAQERKGEMDVPPFTRLAADPRWTRAALIRMMTVPHANMPPPVVTGGEAEDIAAYIHSLRK